MTQDSQTSTGTLRGYLLVLLAASLWATLGVIYTVLARDSGLAAISVAALRAGMGGLLLLGGLFFLRRDWLRINRRALIVVVLYGIFGEALFYSSYVYAILAVGVAVAAVLLYTAPAWVALIAWRFLGEQLTKRHVAALLLTLIGAALVAQVFAMGAVRLDVVGVLWGLLAGLTYGLWSVFNKVGVRHTNPWTLQCYGMLVGAVALLAVQPPLALRSIAWTPQTCFWLLALTLGPTVGASVAYAAGVRTVPVSVASLVATLEPVLAALLAFLVLGETMGVGQMVGGALILMAVWLLRPRISRAP